jgi:general secretion pathway protein M
MNLPSLPPSLKARLDGLSTREQWLLAGGGFALVLTILYFGILTPLQEDNQRLHNAVAQAAKDRVWMEQAATRLMNTQGARQPAHTKVSLASRVSVTMRKYRLEVEIAANGTDKLKISAKGIDLLRLQQALAELETAGITIEHADIQRGEATGSADITMRLRQ